MEAGDTLFEEVNADSSSYPADNKKKGELACLTETLAPYKEALLFVNDILIWKEQWYSYALAGLVTLKFLIIWYLDPTVLSLLAAGGISLTTLDFVIPRYGAHLLGGKPWDEDRECSYDAVCQKLINFKNKVMCIWNYNKKKKEEAPYLHYVAVCSSLAVIGLIGWCVDNLFLLYLYSLTIVLLPGLLHHGIVQKYFSQACSEMKQVIDTKFGKAKPKTQ